MGFFPVMLPDLNRLSSYCTSHNVTSHCVEYWCSREGDWIKKGTFCSQLSPIVVEVTLVSVQWRFVSFIVGSSVEGFIYVCKTSSAGTFRKCWWFLIKVPCHQFSSASALPAAVFIYCAQINKCQNFPIKQTVSSITINKDVNPDLIH